MSDSIYLGLKARQLEDSPTYQPITCIKLTIGGEDLSGNPIVCQWPSDSVGTGRILEVSNPLIWDAEMGNRVAKDIYDTVKGYAYKPFTAEGAIINPAVEIGDAVEVGDVYSVIADVETSFTPLMSANISAPAGSDIDHEYPYESSENRELMQQYQGLKTSFIVQNGEVSWAISQIGAVDQEGSIWNKLTSVQTTVDGITVRTESDVQTIVGSTRINWANINVAPEEIKTEVAQYFDEYGAAASAYDNAIAYTNGEIAAIEGDYKSEIAQSAKEIMSTVASTETIWNVYSLSQTERNKFAVYGYGRPSDENSPNNKTRPSTYRNKYYLDQSTGEYYRSNGSTWTRQGQIAEKLAVSQQSAITQQAGQIESNVSSIDDLNYSMSNITQRVNSISLSVSSANGTSSFTLTDNSGKVITRTLDLTVDAANITGTLTANRVAANADITSPYISGGSISGAAFHNAYGAASLELGNNSGGYGDLILYGYSPYTQRKWEVFRVYDNIGGVLFYAYGVYLGTFSEFDKTFYAAAGTTWDFRGATVKLPS